MAEKRIALRPRIAPSVELTLELDDEISGSFTRKFRLSFDAEAIARVENLTGVSFLNGDIFRQPSVPNLGILFWAAVLAHSPEYESYEGLAVILSYMDAGNISEITLALFEAFIVRLPPEKQKIIRETMGPHRFLVEQAPAAEPASSLKKEN
jgi:hypothetical protein